ncbi:MAG TPA: FtsX-like permease family protein [Streptosporangiaceae bacterium]|nr:FtsX-like permease family protein [Streptosporangiaceae bacterium]
MSAAVRERSAGYRPSNGGVPARRAVIRWAWRLLRREWRQQLLILSLITVAVAATVVGTAVAVNTPTPLSATFGNANERASFTGTAAHVNSQIANLQRRYGRVEVIESETLSVPGSVQSYDLRAQSPRGAFGQPMLALVSGHYPNGPGQVALTSGLAAQLRLTTGGTWHAAGQSRRVVGIVSNPQDLLDAFALVAPGQVGTPTQVTVLFDSPRPIANQEFRSRQLAATSNVINPATIAVAATTLGMMLIALVATGGFAVLAQRRLRSIGMLGAQGATNRHIGLMVRANGVATGIAGALMGAVIGLLAWLAYRPEAEAGAHHVIGAFQLPWLVIGLAVVLAVLASYVAAARPARAIARVPIVAALAGRPPEPRQARRWALPAGLACLVVAFFLIGLAAAKAGQPNSQPFGQLILGLVAAAAGVVLVSPACLGGLARLSGRAPVVLRLALRDLARYRARSGAALGAISLSVLIATIICVASAARFGNPLDYTGPNLAASQILVQPATSRPDSSPAIQGQSLTRTQLASLAAAARRIAALIGSHQVITLDAANASLNRAAPGRNWYGTLYVATPALLRAFGVTAAQVGRGTDIVTMRPGLDTLSRMQLLNSAKPQFGPQGPQSSWPCPPASCIADPKIVEVSALPSGTSAPNTVVTEHAVHELGLTSSTSGWLIQTRDSITAPHIAAAQQAAAAAGLTVETRNNIPTLTEITDAATAFGVLLALGILAMSVGLVRSETAGDLRTLAATGAGGGTRRALTAATAGTLALTGAVVGTAGGYLVAIGFFRTSKLDALSSLRSIPLVTLLLILVGLPAAAVLGGWLLGGREPATMARQPAD